MRGFAHCLSTVLLALMFTSGASAASVDGMSIYWASTGGGKATVVLVHGWTCDSSSWDAQVPVLAKHYRVIALDLPGHGRSGSPKDGKFSMDLFARAVEAVRVEGRTEKIVLVGHSMGALVIRQYARRYPGHVAGLVAVDAPLDLRHFGEGFTPPSFAGPEGLKRRQKMIREMFAPADGFRATTEDPDDDAQRAGGHGHRHIQVNFRSGPAYE